MITSPLQELTDRQAITDLVSRLGVWLDEMRFDDPRSIFTENVTVSTPGGQAEGIDRVVAQASRNHDVEGLQHLIANVLVDLEGDRATIGANLIVTFVARADAPESSSAHGERYRFEAVRTHEGWRLSRVEVRPVWRAGR
jgi:hypothetical protein